MTYLASRLAGPANVASGSSTIFTGTGGHVYTVRSIIFANNSAAPITLKIGVNGITDADLVLAATAVQPGDTLVFDPMMLVLSGAETIQANASVGGGTLTVNGVDAS